MGGSRKSPEESATGMLVGWEAVSEGLKESKENIISSLRKGSLVMEWQENLTTQLPVGRQRIKNVHKLKALDKHF